MVTLYLFVCFLSTNIYPSPKEVRFQVHVTFPHDPPRVISGHLGVEIPVMVFNVN